jgi:hypothetical protein
LAFLPRLRVHRVKRGRFGFNHRWSIHIEILEKIDAHADGFLRRR